MIHSCALRFCLVLLLAAIASQAAAQNTRVYKWLDENGNIHYSDRLPSDPNAVQREVLNRDGVRIRQLDIARLTPAAAAQRQEVLRNAQRDVALTVSFDTEDDLRHVHEERLSLIRSGLEIARTNTQRLEDALAAHEAHAASLQASGKPLPIKVQENIEQARRMLAEQQAETHKLEQRYNETLAMQNAELSRYRELAAEHR